MGVVVATVCARGGSKGLPGKNVRPLAGVPLIAHTIAHALAVPNLGGVFVSTDDQVIAEASRAAGAQVPYLRPLELATDTAPKLPVIEHLVAHLEAQGQVVDAVVDLQPTSPLRVPADISNAMELLDVPCDGEQPELVLSVCKAHESPYFNLAEADSKGWLHLSKPHTATNRQSLPPVYALNGSIYVWRRDALGRSARAGGSLWANRIVPYVMPRARSVDIDDLEDFEYAEWLFQRQARDGKGAA